MEFTVSAVTNIAVTIQDKECPICYDCVSNNVNMTTTECGHCFHTSCLLKSCSINGFNCPMCRNNMINNNKNTATANANATTTQEEDDDELDTEVDFVRELQRSNALGEMFGLMALLMSHSRTRDRLARDRPTPTQPPISETRLPTISEITLPPINFEDDYLFHRWIQGEDENEIDNYVEDMIEQRNFGMENR